MEAKNEDISDTKRPRPGRFNFTTVRFIPKSSLPPQTGGILEIYFKATAEQQFYVHMYINKNIPSKSASPQFCDTRIFFNTTQSLHFTKKNKY